MVKLEGDDVAAAILRFALEKAVTLVLVGQSRRRWWKRLRQGSVTQRLIKNARGLNIMVVAFGVEDQQPARRGSGEP